MCRDVAEPDPGPDDLLIEVHATGMVFPDVLHTRGAYQDARAAVHPRRGVRGRGAGGPVGIVAVPGRPSGGACPIGALADGRRAPLMTLPLPDTVELDAAACLPINYLTAAFALGDPGRAAGRGETVLVARRGRRDRDRRRSSSRPHSAPASSRVTSTPEKAALARRGRRPRGGGRRHVPGGGRRAHRRAGRRRRRGPRRRATGSPTRCAACARGGRLLVVGFTAGEIPTVRVNRLLLTNTDVRGVGWAKPTFAEPGVRRRAVAGPAAAPAHGRAEPPGVGRVPVRAGRGGPRRGRRAARARQGRPASRRRRTLREELHALGCLGRLLAVDHLRGAARARRRPTIGEDALWVSEAWGQDAVSILAVLADRTERIHLGSALMQIPARPPTAAAMAAATIDVILSAGGSGWGSACRVRRSRRAGTACRSPGPSPNPRVRRDRAEGVGSRGRRVRGPRVPVADDRGNRASASR